MSRWSVPKIWLSDKILNSFRAVTFNLLVSSYKQSHHFSGQLPSHNCNWSSYFFSSSTPFIKCVEFCPGLKCLEILTGSPTFSPECGNRQQLWMFFSIKFGTQVNRNEKNKPKTSIFLTFLFSLFGIIKGITFTQFSHKTQFFIQNKWIFELVKLFRITQKKGLFLYSLIRNNVQKCVFLDSFLQKQKWNWRFETLVSLPISKPKSIRVNAGKFHIWTFCKTCASLLWLKVVKLYFRYFRGR